MALLASTRGARMVLTARRRDELERVRAACAHPQDIAVLPLDLTQFDAEVAKREAEAFFGPIDILVNNAGILQRSLLVDTSLDEIGRASCRESVWKYGWLWVVAGYLKKNNNK